MATESRIVHGPIDVSSIRSKRLLSPKYSKSPTLGSLLRTPPDDLPRVPDRQKLMSTSVIHTPTVPIPVVNTPSARLPPPKATPIPKVETYNTPIQETRTQISPTPIPQVNLSPGGNVENAKRRADYRVKFAILREAYPSMNIPEPEATQTLDEIDAMYKMYIKRIHIDSSVEHNKLYLLVLWIVIEVVAVKYLNLPFTGYAVSQQKYMTKYRMMLIELGERSYSSTVGEGWPVEIKILITALINGVIFLLLQVATTKLGSGVDPDMAAKLTNMVNSYLMENQGSDVLRRAEEATSDKPIPPATTTDDSNPLGMLGPIVSGFLPMLGSMLPGGSQPQQPAAPPQKRRATTFGARHRQSVPSSPI